MIKFPYIGITDFTSFEQVVDMLEVFQKHKPSWSARQLHVGVMMSYKTLNHLSTSWAKSFPQSEDIVRIFQPVQGDVFYCLHYADYDDMTSFIDLRRAISYSGPELDAIQLDMTWPSPQLIIDGVRNSGKHLEVILQIGKAAFERIRNNPAVLVDRLSSYEGCIDRVLLDKSVGHGIGLDASELLPFAKAIKERFRFEIGAAGGLGPDSVQLVKPLASEFPGLSIDAQSKLRKTGDAHDPIDWDLAENYLIRALQILK